MARLIDSNIYCIELRNEMNYPGRSEEFMTAIDVAIADLSDAPTVDAVPVSELKKLRDYLYSEDLISMRGLSELNKLIANCSQAIDSVEIVRCKYCAVPHNKYTGCPKLNGLVTPPDFYCPFGERKDGDGNG